MDTYIAMLRGINVSGHKIIKMADLRDHLSKYGLESVQTYIQSGNIVFQHSKVDEIELSKKIHDLILLKYDFHVPVMIRTAEEIKSVISRNPYTHDDSKGVKRNYITFLSEIPIKTNIQKIDPETFRPDEFIIDKRTIYIYYPLGAGKSKMTINFFEKKLGVNATSRNCKTVNKLYEMANS